MPIVFQFGPFFVDSCTAGASVEDTVVDASVQIVVTRDALVTGVVVVAIVVREVTVVVVSGGAVVAGGVAVVNVTTGVSTGGVVRTGCCGGVGSFDLIRIPPPTSFVKASAE